MKITFEPEDIICIAKGLRNVGREATDDELEQAKTKITAAFEQQLEDEAEYLFND